MSTRTVVILAALGGVALWFLYGDSEDGGVVGDVRQAFLDAVAGITRGARVTRCSYDKTTGIVPCDPGQLASQAGVDDETYALARAISSEEGESSSSTKAIVGWANKNEAARRGISIFALLTETVSKYDNDGPTWTGHNTVKHSGMYGSQANLEVTVTSNGRQVHPSDRFASTAQDPYDDDIAIATGILDGTIPDVTGGANQFDRPSGESNPDAVAAKRINAGSELVTGIDDLVDGDLRVWRVSGVS